MATKRKHISLFDDSSSRLELDAFKKKIKKLYDEILERTYKIENPGASPEEIAAYVEENGLEFPDDDNVDEETSEIDNLMDMLDSMTEDQDTLEPAKELSTESKPKEHKGVEPSSKSHEAGTKVETTEFKDRMGGLFSVKKDERKRTATKAPQIPTGKSIKRDTSTSQQINFAPLVEQFKDELRSLSERQAAGVRHFREGI
jgi:hypothetical protein|tara:strand:+ start:1277 stop:1879 length:603 start_codon:yes stop_codon:yes gene_type:complete